MRIQFDLKKNENEGKLYKILPIHTFLVSLYGSSLMCELVVNGDDDDD